MLLIQPPGYLPEVISGEDTAPKLQVVAARQPMARRGVHVPAAVAAEASHRRNVVIVKDESQTATWDERVTGASGRTLTVRDLATVAVLFVEELDVPFPDAAARDGEALSLLDQAIDIARRPVDGADQ
ncbi:hypothetical protein [Curtobacterium sp. 1544]|uniref:hypothetical protein n=1 Tax=Curtobacterium sp. 1544 TaxID=3156417 RepID=UPI003398F35C